MYLILRRDRATREDVESRAELPDYSFYRRHGLWVRI
jgi:hypothetical protein